MTNTERFDIISNMKKILNVGLLAHVDAGKTTITENLLYLSGQKRTIGKVDDGTSTTDYLDVEKRRGISVKASSVSVNVDGVKINIIDTPGHADFISEVERALTALDLAIIIISAVEGIQPQTKTIFKAVNNLNIPSFIFINKIDRAGADANKVFSELKKLLHPYGKNIIAINLQDINGIKENESYFDDACELLSEYDESVLDKYLEGELSESEIEDFLNLQISNSNVFPVFCGSGKMNVGVEKLLKKIISFTPVPFDGELCGFVYKLDHDKTLGAIAHVRLFSGAIERRDNVFIPRLNKEVKITQIKSIQGGKLLDITSAQTNDLFALCGIDEIKAGDFIGKEISERLPHITTPYFTVKAECAEEKKSELLKCIQTLDSEDPSISYEWVKEKREIIIRTTGKVHLETLKEIIYDRFSLSVEFTQPSVIYKETPSKEAFGFECYTMPKPCWAVVHFFITPLEAGGGIQFESVVSEKKIKYKYQEHIKTSLYNECIKQGLHGWEVTDAKFTLIGGEDHVEHTHPLDFFVATPMAFMDGLRNCSSTLLEPILSADFTVETSRSNKIISFIESKRGRLISNEISDGNAIIRAEIPASETFDMQNEFLSLTSGKGECYLEFSRYAPVPEGMGCDRERTGINPLDRAKWILHARQAL